MNTVQIAHSIMGELNKQGYMFINKERYEQLVYRVKNERKKKYDKETVLKEFLLRHSPLENEFKKHLSILFDAQRQEVLRNIANAKTKSIVKKDVTDEWLFDHDEWLNKFKASGQPIITQGVAEGALLAIRQLPQDFDYDRRSAETIKFINDKTYRFSEETIAYTELQLKQAWGKTLDELKETLTGTELINASIPTVTAQVNQIFDFAEKYRATRIARTEITGSVNYGTQDAYIKSGVVEKNQWVSAEDERVRETHARLDAMGEDNAVVPGDEFEIVNLKYPGDPEGEPEEIMSCRCTLIPIIQGL